VTESSDLFQNGSKREVSAAQVDGDRPVDFSAEAALVVVHPIHDPLQASAIKGRLDFLQEVHARVAQVGEVVFDFLSVLRHLFAPAPQLGCLLFKAILVLCQLANDGVGVFDFLVD